MVKTLSTVYADRIMTICHLLIDHFNNIILLQEYHKLQLPHPTNLFKISLLSMWVRFYISVERKIKKSKQ